MLLPVSTIDPLISRLAGGEFIGDFDLVKPRPAGHGVLIGDKRAFGAQPSIIAFGADMTGEGEATAIGKAGKAATVRPGVTLPGLREAA